MWWRGGDRSLGFQATTVIVMPGAILLVLALIGFPVVVGLSTAGLAALIGFFLQKDADKRHEGSELIDVNI